MLDQKLQSKTYQFDTHTTILADGTKEIKVFYNLSWGILYKYKTDHPYTLVLTLYNGEIVEITNHTGFWQSPQDVWYKKIELKRAQVPAAADTDTDLAGVITFQSVEVYNSSDDEIQYSSITLANKLDYYLKNTKTLFLTVPAGVSLEEALGGKQVYDFYDFQYCLENGLESTDEDQNWIQFGADTEQITVFDWVKHAPVDYYTVITNGNTVRLDVYLRYWAGEPGERL